MTSVHSTVLPVLTTAVPSAALAHRSVPSVAVMPAGEVVVILLVLKTARRPVPRNVLRAAFLPAAAVVIFAIHVLDSVLASAR